MAKAGGIAAITLALGVIALWAPNMLLQAFVPATGPSHAPQDRFLGVSDASTQGSASASFGVATAAISMVAALATGRLLNARQQRRASAPVVACRAVPEALSTSIPKEMVPMGQKEYYELLQKEKDERGEVFAQGLIGGESAFSSGDYNFDPLQLARRFPRAVPWFREAEIKHGRICMLAWLGLVVPDLVRIPGPERCYTAPNVVAAHMACVGTNEDATSPLGQVLAFVSLIEICTILPKAKQGVTIENAGDYKLGLNFLPKDETKAKEMKLKELKNGRLAMMAFGGAITQATLSGNGFPWLY